MKMCKGLLVAIFLFASSPLGLRAMDVVVGAHGIIGKRKSMEDAHMNYSSKGVCVCGVFDGHGGSDCAEYLAENNRMGKLIVEDEEFIAGNDAERALKRAFNKADEDYCKLVGEKIPTPKNYTSGNEKYQNSGTTVVVAVIDMEKNNLYTANAGDARVVIGRSDGSVERLSYDHKINLDDKDEKSELNRIKTSGFGSKIIWQRGFRVNNNAGTNCLAVTRAIGDKDYKPYVTSDPFFKSTRITPNDRFLILACDGVWDVMTDEEAVHFVNTEMLKKNYTPENITKQQAQDITEAFVNEAAKNPEQTDNVTAMIVFFNHSASKLSKMIDVITHRTGNTEKNNRLKKMLTRRVK